VAKGERLVSAEKANTALDKVRELGDTLYRAAKADPRRRFHALYDKVYRRDIVERAWELVRRNGGAAGIDRVTIATVEEYGVERLLGEVAEELRTEQYRPQAARRVWIPKPGTTKKRPLSIPVVRDRIVQAALKLVIEPIFEADFLEVSYGFRPGRKQHDALQVLLDEAWRGRRWVVETDVADCFESIPHDRLMAAVEERIVDRKLLKLIRSFLRAGVLEEGAVRRAVTGTPQGGVVSPLLCNIYLHRLDREWERRGRGVLVRYADDLVVMCWSKAEAESGLAELTAILAGLGLEPKAAKTRIVELREGGEGFDFLGFSHRLAGVPSRTGNRRVLFLVRWPSRKAMQHARDRIREMTERTQLRKPPEVIVQGVNRYLRGWAGYFRHGNSTEAFQAIRAYAADRVVLFVAKLRRCSRAQGWQLYYRSPDHFGLVYIDGTVVLPRPRQTWQLSGAEYRR
jgi:group II intron reverse transcriptase/maturase